MRSLFVCILLGMATTGALAQSSILSFEEYMAQVKAFHPVVKQAQLQLEMSEAALLESRGGFDPKIEVDFESKEFKNTEYYNNLNSSFKIPTWYGIELKASWEQNSGQFLNPQKTVPEDGLYSAGVQLSLKEGFLLTKRMAAVKKATLFVQQTQAERDLLVTEILYEAATAYIEWLKAYKERSVYQNILSNAETRFRGVQKQSELGALAAIDSTEAKIAFQNRQLSLEAAQLNYVKTSLEIANYLWVADNIPVELQEGMVPGEVSPSAIDDVLSLVETLLSSFSAENHPKILSAARKLDQLQLDARLKANLLLPDVTAYYNFLTTEPTLANSLNTDNLKAGLQLSVPLFLRKERGALKLARTKVRDGEYALANTRVQLQNKLNARLSAITSYETQFQLINDIVQNTQTLWRAESRKFELGESSLFLVISRENNYIEARLKEIDVENKWFQAKIELFKTLAQPNLTQ